MTSPVRVSQESKPTIEEGDQPQIEDSPSKELPPSTPVEEENSLDPYDPLFSDEDASGSAAPSPKDVGKPQAPKGVSVPGRSRTTSGADSTWPTIRGTPPMKHGVRALDPVKYASFSNDLLMTATFGGSLFLWDRREAGNVGRLENDRAPPWCISVSVLSSL